MRTLGVVFPVKNNLFFTKQILLSIQNHKVKNYDKVVVCVIDNASTDETPKFLTDWAVQDSSNSRFVISNKDNKGFGPACNQGIKLVLQEYPDADVLVMNNDMELLEGCFDALYETAYSQEDIGIVGGRLLFPDGRVQHAGAFLSLWGWGQHKGGGMPDSDKFNQMEVEEVEYVTGALFLIKGALLKLLPGFDERFSPVYFEEVDYCYAARALGYRTYYCPTARAIHYENATGKQVYGDLAAVNQRSHENQIKFYTKYDEREPVDSGNPHKILFVNRIYGEWSFCVVMRNLAKGLARSGVDVAIAPEEYHQVGNMDDWEIKEMMNKPHDYWNRVVFRSAEADHMYLLPPGKKRVAHTTG
jgi:GT2 family glycosyltransferase